MKCQRWFQVCILLLFCNVSFAAESAPKGQLFTNISTSIQRGSIGAAIANSEVPPSPAFTALGVSPKKVDHPASPYDFALDLINGIDDNGNFQSGIAIDTPIYKLLALERTIQQYRDSFWTRAAANSSLSFGTAKGVSNSDNSLKMAVGAKYSWITEDTDKRRNIR
ncbi:hypothetical protein GMSM_46740 [Geomonas sp. Red276]